MTPAELGALERQIHLETNLPRNDFYPQKWVPSPTSRALVQKYLIAIGGREGKILAATDYVLANAYRIGENYIRKMNEVGFQHRLNRTGGNGRRGNLDLNLDEMNLLHDVNLDIPDNSPFNEPQPRLQPEPEHPENRLEVPTTTVDPTQIARAAEQVLARALNQATQQLAETNRKEIARQLEDIIKAAKLSDVLKTEIITLAQQAANDAAIKAIPRQLEIKLPNSPPRILPAEPRHAKFDQLLRYLTRKHHIYIVGPAGTGKTKLGAQLADALDKKFYPIAQALTKYDVSGYKSPTGEYVGTLMREAIEFGGLALIDEGDTWAAAALMFLNAPLANGYCAFPDRVVPVHPEFLCIIAANTFGRGADRQYQGRNPLDGASLNRFKFVEVDYDRNLETQLFGAGPWVQYCWRVREAIESLKISHIISMRNIAFCLADAECGDDPNEIASACLWQNLAPDTISKIKNIAGQPPQRDANIRDFGT